MLKAVSLPLLVTLGLAIMQTDAKAISWGEADLNNDHPYVVMLATPIPGTELAEFCSGVLLSSTHVLTAAHCVDEGDLTLVFAGLSATQNLVSLALLPADHGHIHPEFVDVGIGPDLAVLKLAFPVGGFGLAKLPELGAFRPAARGAANERVFEVVGYGTQGVSAMSSEEMDPTALFGIRQVGEQIFLASNQGVGGGNYVQLSSNAGFGGGACLGDSGGPVMAEDNTVVAVNSSGTTANCAGMSVSARVDTPTAQAFISERLQHLAPSRPSASCPASGSCGPEWRHGIFLSSSKRGRHPQLNGGSLIDT